MTGAEDDHWDVFVVGLDAPSQQVALRLEQTFHVSPHIASTLVSNVPARVKANVDRSRAEQFARAFREAGARVEVRPAKRASKRPEGGLSLAAPAPATVVVESRPSVRAPEPRVSRSPVAEPASVHSGPPDRPDRRMCDTHPQLGAIGACTTCRKSVCARCSRGTSQNERICSSCVEPMLRARRKHLSAEGDLMIFSALHVLAAFILAMLTIVALVLLDPQRHGLSRGIVALVFGVPMMVLVGIEICIGEGLRRMRPWVWTPALVFACWGSLLVPFGTIPNVLLVRLLLSEHGRAILSPSYSNVVALTPELHHRTSRAGALATTFVILSLLALGVGAYSLLR